MLIALISLLALFSLALTLFSTFLAQLFYDPNDNSSSVQWIGLALVGLYLLAICIVGLRGSITLNLEQLLTFFWGIIVFVAPLVLSVIICFNVYTYLDVTFKHQWEFNNFKGVRETFCEPGTADNKCAAPYRGGSKFASTTQWCQEIFNATDCSAIRGTALHEALSWGSQLTLIQAFVSVGNICIILMTIFITYRMLTRAVITESMNDVINYLLVLPICGCAGLAWYMWDWQHYKHLPYWWAPTLFIALAVGQLVSLPTGVLAGRLKSQRMLTFYMFMLTLIGAGLCAVGAFGIIYAGLIPQTYKPSKADTSFIACRKQLAGCCCCQQNFTEFYLRTGTYISDKDFCPQWDQSDVISLLVFDLKISGAVALILIIYLVGALTVAFFVRMSLKNYKSDFI